LSSESRPFAAARFASFRMASWWGSKVYASVVPPLAAFLKSSTVRSGFFVSRTTVSWSPSRRAISAAATVATSFEKPSFVAASMTKACDGVGLDASVGSGTSETFTLCFGSAGSLRSLAAREVERRGRLAMLSSRKSGLRIGFSPNRRCVSGALFCAAGVNESRISMLGGGGGVRVGAVDGVEVAGFVGTLFVVDFGVVGGGR
jgi:hypothetical protein